MGVGVGVVGKEVDMDVVGEDVVEGDKGLLSITDIDCT